MDMYSSGTSKKKMLVPLVVLMLCAVALVGAGYAYTASTVTSDDSPIDGDYYSIDMYSEKTGTTVVTAPLEANTHFKVYTTKIVGGEYYTAMVNATTLTYTAYIKVTTDINASTYGISTSAVYNAATVTDSAGNAVVLNVTTPGTVVVKAIDGNGDATGDALNTITGGTVYIMTVTFTVNTSTFGQFSTPAALATALDNFDGSVDITVNATLN